VQETKVYR